MDYLAVTDSATYICLGFLRKAKQPNPAFGQFNKAKRNFSCDTFHDEYNQLNSPNKYGYRQGPYMDKKKAIEKLNRQLQLIKELASKSIDFPKFKVWKGDTEEVIRSAFPDNERPLLRFKNIKYYHGDSWDPYDGMDDPVQQYNAGLEEAVLLLKSFVKQVEEREPVEPSTAPKTEKSAGLSGSDIFIVHGCDEGTKEAVARYVEKLGLKAVILHEQANQSRTIIEKFEDHSKDVSFAVVLCTPDDEGRSGQGGKLKPRARQNVILELGFFLGQLGRDRVCVLYGKGVEMPSDYDGVVYIPLDGDWKVQLAKEIKAAGISIDADKII